jgi:hypothetical protein
MDWILELNYYDPVDGWYRLNSYYGGGYLHNNWYQLRIQRNGTNNIDYTLAMTDLGIIDSEQGGKLAGSFANFEQVVWSTDTNPDPAVCPLFFWDEHRIGLNYPT